MRISFKEQFVDKILSGTKVHTARFGKRQYKPGMKLELCTGPDLFHKTVFKTVECIAVQNIRIELIRNPITVRVWDDARTMVLLPLKEQCVLREFAQNDGFLDEWEMAKFFFDMYPPDWLEKPFKLPPTGQLIWWGHRSNGRTDYLENAMERGSLKGLWDGDESIDELLKLID